MQTTDSAQGIFISFEGGDSVGKTTHIRQLADWLRKNSSYEVVVTREPGGTVLGAQLREILLHGQEMTAKAEALIYAADRAQHVAEVIRPALERGAIVITDRYLDSSVAYQGGGRVLGPDEVEQLSLWATDQLLPTRTFLLDLDPQIGAARRRGTHDRLESAGDEFHHRTRDFFLQRATNDPNRWVVIDADQPIDVISEIVVEHVTELLAGVER
ncbi:dTMP kinase [Micrococcales bacterium KH10]|nr:dTMP kinase [Micrococcales bacterium KH10]